MAGEQGTPQAVAESAETRLALARARIVTGDLSGAGTVLADRGRDRPGRLADRLVQGLRDLAASSPGSARDAFDAVYDVLPGELAPKLALAFAAEAAGDPLLAGRYFQLVWTVDRSYVSAAFGLARTRLHAGDRAGAIAALAAVPDTSSHYLAAQIAAVRIQVSAAARPGRCRPPTICTEAGPAARPAEARSDIRSSSLRPRCCGPRWTSVLAKGAAATAASCSAASSTERALRFGLERSYRAQAQLASDRGRRTELVDHGQRRPSEDVVMTGPAPPRAPRWQAGRGRRRRLPGDLPVLRPAGRAEDNFCEACRAELAPRGGQRRGSPGPSARCPACQSAHITADGYCESCGYKVPSGRDHVELDLGLRGRGDRSRPAAPPQRGRDGAGDRAELASGPVALAVVCDGVSTSSPGRGVAGRVQAAVQVLLAAVRSGADLAEASPRRGRGRAEGAGRAWPTRRQAARNAPSATFVSAVVTAEAVTVCWLGDSRAYWIDAAPARRVEAAHDRRLRRRRN